MGKQTCACTSELGDDQSRYLVYTVCVCLLRRLLTVQDASVARLIKDSNSLEKIYRHWFDLTVVNNDIEQTIETVLEAVSQTNSLAQWIPVSWIY